MLLRRLVYLLFRNKKAQAQFGKDDGIEINDIWLSDDLWFQILSYANDGVLHNYSLIDNAGAPELFRNVGFVSRAFLASSRRYLENFAPTCIVLKPFRPVQSFRVKFACAVHGYKRISTENSKRRHFRLRDKVRYTKHIRSLQRMSWAVKNEIHLHQCNFHVFGEESRALVKFILTSCDISKLQSLAIHDRKLFGMDAVKSSALRAGLPAYIFKERDKSTNSAVCFQHFLAKYLPTHARELKRLTIETSMGKWYLPLFTSLSYSLEELDLNIPKWFSRDCQQNLSETIAQLPNLKKVSLHFNRSCRFQLCSQSLEEIDTEDSYEGSYIDKCDCPSLKTFHCKYSPYRDDRSNGVILGKPLGKKFVEEMKVTRKLEFKVNDHPFLGMNVPDTCVVKMYYRFTSRSSSYY